ncbi:MAG: hypothetical protein IH859_08365 [Chloroflexi bacterium]|nr:hypothetical protein [Chloroflexota bacterium]
MKQRKLTRRTIILPVLAALLIAVLAVGIAFADNQWSSYHYERPSSAELILDIGDCHTPSVYNNWSAMLTNVIADWNNIPGAGDNPEIGFNLTACGATINSYNDDYGNTGWLGLASIRVSRGRYAHIVSGRSQINEFYIDYPDYFGFDQAVEWQQVLCQEIGHDFGLNHNREGSSGGTPDDTCMNDDIRPLRFPSPNVHDDEMFTEMYTHNHGESDSGSKPCNPKSKKCNAGAASYMVATWAESYASTAEMAASADVIVVATVRSTLPAAASNNGNVPFTFVVFSVDDVLKGSLGSEFRLQQTGGNGLFIVDDPAYSVGEQYILYLRAIDSADGTVFRVVNPAGRVPTE